MVLVPVGRLGRQLVRLLFEQFQRVGFVDFFAFGGRDAVFAPLPQLAAGDFGGGGVFLLGGDVLLVWVTQFYGRGRGGGRERQGAGACTMR